jgi:hypothetical protein
MPQYSVPTKTCTVETAQGKGKDLYSHLFCRLKPMFRPYLHRQDAKSTNGDVGWVVRQKITHQSRMKLRVTTLGANSLPNTTAAALCATRGDSRQGLFSRQDISLLSNGIMPAERAARPQWAYFSNGSTGFSAAAAAATTDVLAAGRTAFKVPTKALRSTHSLYTSSTG